MEFKGMIKSGLELTVATPRSQLLDLNSIGYDDASSYENATAHRLDLVDTISRPPHGGHKDVLTESGVDLEGGDAGASASAGAGAGAGSSAQQTRIQYRKLSKEQTDELEATFQQSNFIDRRTKEVLAERLKIKLKRVEVWFMNRRCRLRKEQAEETHMHHKEQVEALTRKTGRLQRKIEKLKKRNKELKEKLKEKTMAAPSPSVMLLPLPQGLNALAASSLSTHQGSATAVALRSTTAQPLLPSGAGGSIV